MSSVLKSFNYFSVYKATLGFLEYLLIWRMTIVMIFIPSCSMLYTDVSITVLIFTWFRLFFLVFLWNFVYEVTLRTCYFVIIFYTGSRWCMYVNWATFEWMLFLSAFSTIMLSTFLTNLIWYLPTTALNCTCPILHFGSSLIDILFNDMLLGDRQVL